MPYLHINNPMSIEEKLGLMQEDARFDVANDREAADPGLADIKNSIKSKPGPPSAPKLFLSNDCIFNCAYCGCRSGADKRCYRTEPKELAQFAVDEAFRKGQGIFITSAIYKNPDYTAELIIETMKVIRNDIGFKGYVHAKIMPGTDPGLIRLAGRYANRLSVNIEVARSEGYAMIAKNKNKRNILTPMRQIRDIIREENQGDFRWKSRFATSQCTQLMAGSTGEDDYTVLRLAGALYKNYALKRVYYTPYQCDYPAEGYEDLQAIVTPKWRQKRLYQADRLMEIYGFSPEEIAPEAQPFLAEDLDPKASWVLRNLQLFPVEVNKADYDMLIRVPGIGVTYAQRIIKARRYCSLTFDSLEGLGVSLKRSGPFLTCGGKFRGKHDDDPGRVRELLVDKTNGPSPEQTAFSAVVNKGGMIFVPDSYRRES